MDINANCNDSFYFRFYNVRLTRTSEIVHNVLISTNVLCFFSWLSNAHSQIRFLKRNTTYWHYIRFIKVFTLFPVVNIITVHAFDHFFVISRYQKSTWKYWSLSENNGLITIISYNISVVIIMSAIIKVFNFVHS